MLWAEPDRGALASPEEVACAAAAALASSTLVCWRVVFSVANGGGGGGGASLDGGAAVVKWLTFVRSSATRRSTFRPDSSKLFPSAEAAVAAPVKSFWMTDVAAIGDADGGGAGRIGRARPSSASRTARCTRMNSDKDAAEVSS
jgi:hypothetical protein